MNLITCNTLNGILCSNKNNYTDIIGNNISLNKKAGIYADDYSIITIIFNQILYNSKFFLNFIFFFIVIKFYLR